MMKICSTCTTPLAFSAFYSGLHKDGVNRLASSCKDCARIYSVKWKTARRRAAGVKPRGCAPIAKCLLPTCNENGVKTGLCMRHYRMKRAHGVIQDNAPGRIPISECAVSGCSRPPRSPIAGICEVHYYRQRRTGSVEDPVIVGRSLSKSTGYWIILAKDHPLARLSGHALEHRVVLYNTIGPGWHNCTYCQTPVCWEKHYPEDLDALVVDHVDMVKMNNDIANLVPSCFLCNIARSRGK